MKAPRRTNVLPPPDRNLDWAAASWLIFLSGDLTNCRIRVAFGAPSDPSGVESVVAGWPAAKSNGTLRAFLRRGGGLLAAVVTRHDAKRKSPEMGLFLSVSEFLGLGPEGVDDVLENVLDLAAHREKDDDDHDRNENQDQGVLDHALALLLVKQATQLPDEIRHLGTSFLQDLGHFRPR
jgi:hypothetical protein